jgi:hypothetical protein
MSGRLTVGRVPEIVPARPRARIRGDTFASCRQAIGSPARLDRAPERNTSVDFTGRSPYRSGQGTQVSHPDCEGRTGIAVSACHYVVDALAPLVQNLIGKLVSGPDFAALLKS